MAKHVGMQMPPDLVAALKGGKIIGTLATFNEEGWPHTTPVQCLYPVSNDAILLSLHKKHTSYSNICWQKRVMISFLDTHNIAYAIKGRAGVIRAPSRIHPEMNIVRIDINDVKSDKSIFVRIDKGVQWSFTSIEAQELYEAMYSELRLMSNTLLKGKVND